MSQPYRGYSPGGQPSTYVGNNVPIQPPLNSPPMNGAFAHTESLAKNNPGQPLTNGHFPGQFSNRMPPVIPRDQVTDHMSNLNINGTLQKQQMSSSGFSQQPTAPPIQAEQTNVSNKFTAGYNHSTTNFSNTATTAGLPPNTGMLGQSGISTHSQLNHSSTALQSNQNMMPLQNQLGPPQPNAAMSSQTSGMSSSFPTGIPPYSNQRMPPRHVAGMPTSLTPRIPPISDKISSAQGTSFQSTAGVPPNFPPGMLPHSTPGMPPHSAPGMPPHSTPGMPPYSTPGMPPHSSNEMLSHQQTGINDSSTLNQATSIGYQAPSNYPFYSASSQGEYPQQHDQTQGGPPTSSYSQIGHSAGPTMPGSYPSTMPSGQPRYPPPSGVHPSHQQQKRLTLDQMPSRVQVVEDDQLNREGLFETGAKGAVPPLVTTEFFVEDRGNCNPRLLRSSLYNVPCTADIMKATNIPFALAITPFAKLHEREESPQIVDFGPIGPVRCNRCKAYMCPNMQFVDGGRRFQCCFCGCLTEVPPEYFAHLDHTGMRTDRYERPELSNGIYEMKATTDYCRNNKLPNPPAFIFMLDVSYNSIKSGLVHLMCSRMKEVLTCLPSELGAEESEIRIGFVTYDKEIHFYNVKGTLSQPQMLVVSDIQDVFVPLLDGFLVKLSESEAIIDSLLEQIPLMFAENTQTEVVLGPVIQAGLDAMKAAECAGKLFIFHSSLPNAQAPGLVKNRDDRKVLGTDKEKSLLTPCNNFYTKLGEDCVSAGCGVDLFLFPNTYVDLATIGEVSRLTGGQVYKYTYFQADLDGARFIDDLKDNLSRNIAFDVTMRVRTSTGIRPVDFFGNFYMNTTTDIELAIVDSNKCVTVEVKHDDKLDEAEGAYVQAAVLFTSISGERRLRLLNLALHCTNQIQDVYKNSELDVVINHMAKKGIREILNSNPSQMRDQIMAQSVNILACYRKNCSKDTSEGQLILPEQMKLLPVYSNCVIKSTALQGTDVHTDDRSWFMSLVNSMTVEDSNAYFYPTLLSLHDLDFDSNLLPPAMRCSYEKFSDDGVYLLENGFTMYLWLGINVNNNIVEGLFGVATAAHIDIDKHQLYDFDNPISRRVKGIIKKICKNRNRQMKLIIVRQRDKLEPIFKNYLVEDRGSNGSSSYVDYLCHLHKEIKNVLT